MGRAGKVFSARKLGQMAEEITQGEGRADSTKKKQKQGFRFRIDRSTAKQAVV